MTQLNQLLRDKLEQATEANQSLTTDIHKLTQDWQRAREELEQKELEWRDEEQVSRDKRDLHIRKGGCCYNHRCTGEIKD